MLTLEHKEAIYDILLTQFVRGPFKINNILKNQGLPELKATIISNFVRRLKDKMYHPVKSYQDFDSWCNSFKGDAAFDEFDRPINLGHECQATNNVVKKHYTLREKLVMSEFLAMLTHVASDTCPKLEVLPHPTSANSTLLL